MKIASKVVLIFIILVYFISFVYAGDLDNVKSYDANTKIVTFKNSFLGIPTTTIAEAKLETPQINYVSAGKDIKVAEFYIDLYPDEYKDWATDMVFYDLKKGNIKTAREIKYKVKSTETKEVMRYNYECSIEVLNNGTKITNCKEIEDKPVIIEYDVWNDMDEKTLYKGKTTIGIFTDVGVNERIEWIGKYFGNYVNEWAVWDSSLNNGLLAYYPFDNSNNDSRGIYNLTSESSYVSGKVGNCLKNQSATITNATSGAYLNMTKYGTVNVWMKFNGYIVGTSTDMILGNNPSLGDSEGHWVIPIQNGYNAPSWGGFFHVDLSAGCGGGGNCVEELGTTYPPATSPSTWGRRWSDNWTMITYTWNETTIAIYQNGTMNKSFNLDMASTFNPSNDRFSIDGVALKYFFIDELSFYNRALSPTEVSTLYNDGAGLTYPVDVFTFNSRTPSDLYTTNGMTGMNVSYNIDLTGKVNLSTTQINSLIINESCSLYLNGSCMSVVINTLSNYNSSTLYSWIISDNILYPATYNYPIRSMNYYNKSMMNFSNNEFIKMEFLNLTNNTINFLEAYIYNLTSVTLPLELYYCNNNYTTGNVLISPYCSVVTSISSSSYNHSHVGDSKDYLIPFNVNNTARTINGIPITSRSYFLFKGTNSPNDNWGLKYANFSVRGGITQTSSNNGVSWSNMTATIDAHIHQFSTSTGISFNASTYDNLGNYYSTSNIIDLYDLTNLPPTAPSVFRPLSKSYYKTMPINYTASLPTTILSNISYYRIDLFNSNLSLNRVITANNSLALNYTYNITLIPDGQYYIRVRAVDNFNLSNDGFSSLFNIVTNGTSVNLLYPTNTTYQNTQTYMLVEVLGGALVCNYTTNGVKGSFSCNSNNITGLRSFSGSNFWEVSVTNSSSTVSANVTFVQNCSNSATTLYQSTTSYADRNSIVWWKLKTFLNGTSNISMRLINGTTINDYAMTYNNTLQGYQIFINFTDVGDYYWTIYGDYICPTIDENVSGFIKVRTPFWVNFEIYNNKTGNKYDNDFAYMTAEYSDGYIDDNLEPFINPLIDNSLYPNVFNAKFDNGNATLKLWENASYLIRLIDGQIYFPAIYSQPIILDSYGINVYLGEFDLNESQTIKLLVTEKDLHPYRWLANLLLGIGIILCVLLSITLFFMIPRFPLLAVGFFFISIFGLLAIRLIVWWYGWI